MTKSSPKKRRVSLESIDAVIVVFKLSRWTISDTSSLFNSELVGHSKRTHTHGFVRVRSVNNSSSYHVLRIVPMLDFERVSLTPSFSPLAMVHFVLIWNETKLKTTSAAPWRSCGKTTWVAKGLREQFLKNLSTQYGRIFSSLECSDPSFNMMITSLGNGSGFVRVEE